MTAVFDGRVLRPESPVDLESDTRYLVTIEEISPASTSLDAWALLESLIGTIEAPEDWASEHGSRMKGQANDRGSSDSS